ncbi:hypothetical protein [Halomonas litopenaei]|uniref:hypothetical protein n=1 Tax=Halomonas litopenaei TaxID=2109328 RepID=UPI001A8FE400|nr:hypothetical protein [Halomonas litopenaei]MBN8412140.1 hypothetical protein [Halomonas litopenaei]
MTYCVYTDRETTDPSSEHILPLSLGGHDDFVIDVDRKFNNDIGSKVDGKLANDFLVLFDRDKASAVGHSKKHPIPTVKHARLMDGTPVQAMFGKDGLSLFDLRERKKIERSESRAHQVQCKNIKIDIDIDLMFVAKVALAAGYYAYGNDFVQSVQTDEFRKIMNLDKKNLPTDSLARVYSRFHTPEEGDDIFHILKMMTEIGDCSSVILVPSSETFGVAVSILGKFLGFVSAPCQSSGLVNHGDYKYGHCIYIQNEQVKRFSFDYIRLKLLDKLGK